MRLKVKTIVVSLLMILFCGFAIPNSQTTPLGSFISTVEAASHHSRPSRSSLGRHDMARVQRHYHRQNMRVSRHHYRHYSYVSPAYWHYDNVRYCHGRYRGYWHGRHYCMHSEDWIRLVGLATFASLISNHCVVIY